MQQDYLIYSITRPTLRAPRPELRAPNITIMKKALLTLAACALSLSANAYYVPKDFAQTWDFSTCSKHENHLNFDPSTELLSVEFYNEETSSTEGSWKAYFYGEVATPLSDGNYIWGTAENPVDLKKNPNDGVRYNPGDITSGILKTVSITVKGDNPDATSTWKVYSTYPGEHQYKVLPVSDEVLTATGDQPVTLTFTQPNPDQFSKFDVLEFRPVSASGGGFSIVSVSVELIHTVLEKRDFDGKFPESINVKVGESFSIEPQFDYDLPKYEDYRHIDNFSAYCFPDFNTPGALISEGWAPFEFTAVHAYQGSIIVQWSDSQHWTEGRVEIPVTVEPIVWDYTPDTNEYIIHMDMTAYLPLWPYADITGKPVNENGVPTDPDEMWISAYSNKPEVAYLDIHTGVIKPIGPGETDISVSWSDPDFVDGYFTIHVIVPDPDDFKMDPDLRWTAGFDDGYTSFNDKRVEYQSCEHDFDGYYMPGYNNPMIPHFVTINTEIDMMSLQFESSNPDVAWVGTDGYIAIYGPGETEISVTFPGNNHLRKGTARFTLVVLEPIKPGTPDFSVGEGVTLLPGDVIRIQPLLPDLCVEWRVTDYYDESIVNETSSAYSAAPRRAAAVSDTGWQQGAPGETVEYVIESTDTPIYIYTRSLDPMTGNHSEVKSMKVAEGGTVTGVEGIAVDPANDGVELYNLQGERVDSDNPAPGVYIRRTATRTEKILIK